MYDSSSRAVSSITFSWAYKKLFRFLLRGVVSRIVFRAEVFQSKRPHRGYLRDVLAGFRPVEMGVLPGRMITAPGG